ncbi:MAG: hypothetical protein HYW70_00235 [Candidatus Nealsonbacteria bacterium]|nr:hypothetical protein [Candidatus Nealsonbacteria bacterium]
MEKRLLTEGRIKLIQETVSRILGDPVVKRVDERERCLGWSPPLDKPYKPYRHAFVTYLITPSPANNKDYIEFIKIEVPKGYGDLPWIKEVTKAVHEIIRDNNEPAVDIDLTIFERTEDGSVKSAGHRDL